MENSDFKNPVWKNLVLKDKQVELSFFPAKILLSRLQLTVNKNSSAQLVEKASNEICQLYFMHKDLPNAKKDISLLLKK